MPLAASLQVSDAVGGKDLDQVQEADGQVRPEWAAG